MDQKLLTNVLTSRELAMSSLKKNKFGKKFFHLGPQRDDSLFYNIKKNKTTLDKCDFILCSGLFDEEEKNLKYYEQLLTKVTNKKLVCTNPYFIVHIGGEEEYCACRIAEIFENLGGQVIYFGKPHKEIYLFCLKAQQKNSSY
jgi:hypothetical protein